MKIQSVSEGADTKRLMQQRLNRSEINPDLMDAMRYMKTIQRPPRDKMLKSSKGK